MKEKSLLKNDDGSVLVLALVMLMLLTVLGISASMTSSIEIQISGNDMIYKQNLYMAEAAPMRAAQQIENGGPEMRMPTDPSWPIWLHDQDNNTLPDANNITDASNWTSTYSERLPASIDPQEKTRSLVLFEGIALGESLDMSKTSNVYAYSNYGRCDRNKGVVVIRVGYRKAF